VCSCTFYVHVIVKVKGGGINECKKDGVPIRLASKLLNIELHTKHEQEWGRMLSLHNLFIYTQQSNFHCR
jgi:hypothetical protein